MDLSARSALSAYVMILDLIPTCVGKCIYLAETAKHAMQILRLLLRDGINASVVGEQVEINLNPLYLEMATEPKASRKIIFDFPSDLTNRDHVLAIQAQLETAGLPMRFHSSHGYFLDGDLRAPFQDTSDIIFSAAHASNRFCFTCSCDNKKAASEIERALRGARLEVSRFDPTTLVVKFRV